MSQQQSSITVAITDDHRLFRQGISLILNSIEGIEVSLEASNGLELLDQLKQQNVDLVLLDLEMPVLDGEQTLIELKSNYPEIKVLVLSMYQEDHIILHLLENGANGYVLKDSDPQDLEQAIRRVHQEGVYLDQHHSNLLLHKVQHNLQSKSFKQGVLNDRERETLLYLAQGLTTTQIGEKLFLSPRTIEGYRKEMLIKAEVNNTPALIAWAFRQGLVE